MQCQPWCPNRDGQCLLKKGPSWALNLVAPRFLHQLESTLHHAPMAWEATEVGIISTGGHSVR